MPKNALKIFTFAALRIDNNKLYVYDHFVQLA